MDPAQTDLLGQLTTAIGEVGGDIGAIDLVGTGHGAVVRELVVNAGDPEHAESIVAAAGSLDGVRVVSSVDRTFRMHQGGKIEMTTRVPLRDPRRPLDRLHARRRPGLHGDLRGQPEGLRPHAEAQHGRGRHRRHGRARAWATSARPRACRSWRASRCSSRSSAALTPTPSASTTKDPTRSSSRRSRPSRPLRAASTSRTSPRRVLRGRGPPQGDAGHPGLPRRPARHGGRRAGGAPQRAEDDRREGSRTSRSS